MNSKYQQVIEWIENRIATGELRPGDKLESENQISGMFHISRQTARHSLQMLEQKGLVVRRQGSGTFVNEHSAALSAFKELSRNVTVISTYVDGYIFLSILRAIVARLERENYSVRIQFTNNRLSNEQRILEELLAEDFDGSLIVETTMSGLPNPNLDYYRKLQKKGIPILFFHSYYPDLELPHISMDDDMAGYLAAEHLIKKGHKEIGGIFKLDDGQGIRRYRGYLKALQDYSIDIKEEHVCWVDTRIHAEFNQAAPFIWGRLKNCTGCVCYNDQIACLLTQDAKKIGVRIPEDISLVGIDNSELAERNEVPLTSVEHPLEELGRKVAEQMLEMIKDRNYDPTYEFPVKIVERDSVIEL